MVLNEATIKTKSGQSVQVGPGDFALMRGDKYGENLSYFPVRISKAGGSSLTAIMVLDGAGVEQSVPASDLVGYPNQDVARSEIKPMWPYHYTVLLTHPISNYMVTEQADNGKVERWVFTDAELEEKDKSGLNAYDEFIAQVAEADSGEPIGIVAYRNGEVSNRFDDGTVGVPNDLIEMADQEDSYTTLDGELAENWRDVVVDDDGNFVEFADEEPVERRRSIREQDEDEEEEDDSEDSFDMSDEDMEDEDYEYEYDYDGPMFKEEDEAEEAMSDSYNVDQAEEFPLGTDTGEFLQSSYDDHELGADPLAIFDPGEEDAKGAEGGFKPSKGGNGFSDTDEAVDRYIEGCGPRTRRSGRPRRRVSELAQQQRVRGVKTDVVQRGGETIVTYRGTPVVVFDDTKIELNTGGWKSATTKTRMNQASNEYGLGYNVIQKAGQWYVKMANGETIPFEGDSITIDQSRGMGERRRPRRRVSEAGDRRKEAFAFLDDISQDVADVKSKTDLATAMASHLARGLKISDKEAQQYVNAWFDRDDLSYPTYERRRKLSKLEQLRARRRKAMREQEYLDDTPVPEAPEYPLGMNTNTFMSMIDDVIDIGDEALSSVPDEEGTVSVSVSDDTMGGGVIDGEDAEITAPDLDPVDDDEDEVNPNLPDKLGIIKNDQSNIGDDPLGSVPDEEGTIPSAMMNNIIAPRDQELGDTALAPATDDSGEVKFPGKDGVLPASDKKLGDDPKAKAPDESGVAKKPGKDGVIPAPDQQLSGPALERKRRAARKRRMEALKAKRRKQVREQDEEEYSMYVVDGQYGIYMPQRFAQKFSDEIAACCDQDTLQTLLAGPDEGEDYDWAWDEVVDNYSEEDEAGHTWTIWPSHEGIYLIRDDTPDDLLSGLTERKRRAARKHRMEALKAKRRKQVREQDEDFDQYVDLVVDGSAGIYVPQRFAEYFSDEIFNQFGQETLDILLAGPDEGVFSTEDASEWYWDTWVEVIDNIKIIDGSGMEWNAISGPSGDVFLVREDVPEEFWDNWY